MTASTGAAATPRADRSRSARALAGVLTLALALVSLVVAPRAAAADGGWIRLTHLSPDTPAVNVSLTALKSNQVMFKLPNVGYGDVSPYQRVPAGTYVASMTPAGGNDQSPPAISQSVTVKDGHAYTVAAVGDHAHLTGRVLADDLTPPKKGSAKVRLLQASTSAPTVTVTAVDGPVLARDLAFGTATGYAQVGAAVWTVKVTPSGSNSASPTTAKITARAGSVNTVIILAGKNGSLAVKQLVDAAGTSATPKKGKGVQTGGGGTAQVAGAAGSGGVSPVAGAAGSGGVSPVAVLALLGLAVPVLVRFAIAGPVFTRRRGTSAGR